MPRWAIAICGAGTAGLAAATALAHDGHDVCLFERFDAARPVGAGLMLQPTGLACLAALGLVQPALAFGQRLEAIHGVTRSGRVIFDLPYAALDPHLFSVGIHRAALFKVLSEGAAAAGVEISTSIDIRRAAIQGDKRWLVDRGGQRHGPYDLVVDATGMRSPLRDAEAPIRLRRPYPYGALWAAIEQPADWPHPNQLRQVYDGAQAMAGLLPIGICPEHAGRLVAFFWSLRASDLDQWRDRGLAPWKARVEALWPATAPFLARITAPDQLTFASYADIWLRRPYAERLAFIGDAARAASPQLGQGANLALIDAMALAGALRSVATIEGALAAYAEGRRAHTRFYGYASWALTPFFQSNSRIAGMLRDVSFAPMARIPYLRREMVRTLAGMKTGLFAHRAPEKFIPSGRAAARDAPLVERPAP